MSRRLNIWDFDDTLAWSYQAVERFKRQHPNVEDWKWWHDDKWSVEAALETLPIEDMWERMARTPGEHWILTGRNRNAVLMWMKIWGEHPKLGDEISKIDRVISTSKAAKDKIQTALKKRQEVKRLLPVYDEIHIYDDHVRNIDAVRGLGENVFVHLVQNGRIVSASVPVLDKDLQLLWNAMQSIQGLLTATTSKTYPEVLRSTIEVLRSAQKNLMKELSTQEYLEIASRMLARSKLELTSNTQSLATELDRGYQVEAEVRFDKRLTDFYRHPLRDAYRTIYSLMLAVEGTFDKLQVPVVCRVQEPFYERERLPVGFRVLLWKVGEDLK